MKPEQMRIAIAEACGWKWYRLPNVLSDPDRRYRCLFLPCVLESDGKIPNGYSVADMTERVCNWEYMKINGMVEDYCADLNAMHEAENILIGNHEITYTNALSKIVMNANTRPMTYDFAMVNATARQRAEAFLRTIGAWKEETDSPPPNPTPAPHKSTQSECGAV